MSKTAGDAI